MHPSLQDVGHLYTSEYYVMLYFDPLSLSYLVAHIPFSFGFSNVLECTSVLIDIAIILHKRWKPISYLLELALNRDYSLVLSFNFQPIRSWCCPVLPHLSIYSPSSFDFLTSHENPFVCQWCLHYIDRKIVHYGFFDTWDWSN